MNIDTEDIKRSHNIVEVINRFVPLKKHGSNYFACCPFHNEKSSSFSVSESKQFYHCFGCGAQGDVIKFVQDYSGLDFLDACKELGAEIDIMPTDQVDKNQKASAHLSKGLPSYDKRNPEKAQKILDGVTPCQNGSYQINDVYFYPVIDFDGEIVNAYAPVVEKFVAGGVSHLAFVPIKKNETSNFLVVVDFWDGVRISNETQNNVLIAFSAYNLLLVCNHMDNMKKVPVMRYGDTQAELLCDKSAWVYLDENKKLIKKKKGEYLG